MSKTFLCIFLLLFASLISCAQGGPGGSGGPGGGASPSGWPITFQTTAHVWADGINSTINLPNSSSHSIAANYEATVTATVEATITWTGSGPAPTNHWLKITPASSARSIGGVPTHEVYDTIFSEPLATQDPSMLTTTLYGQTLR